MSTTNNQTRYDFSIHTDRDAGGVSDAAFTLWAEGCVNDEVALHLYQALVDAPWPSGVHTQFSLFKTDLDQTIYEPNLTTTPPSFT